MQKLRLAGIPLIACLLLVGCGPLKFLFPLYADSDKLFDGNLIGEWKVVHDKGSEDEISPSGGDENGRWLFQKTKDELTYDSSQIQLGKNGGIRSKARLVKLGDALFLDFEAAPASDDQQQDVGYPAIPAHAIARIWLKQDEVRLRFIDEKWARRQIKDKAFSMAYVEPPNDLAVLTPTEGLRAFVTRHADDNEVFSVEYKLVRMK